MQSNLILTTLAIRLTIADNSIKAAASKSPINIQYYLVRKDLKKTDKSNTIRVDGRGKPI